MTKVAVIGAGLIGRAWSIVFARAGFDVALWDPFPQQVAAAQDFIADRLPELHDAGLLDEDPAAIGSRIRPAPSLANAVRDVEHVQENGPERVADKQSLFAELDLAARADAVKPSTRVWATPISGCGTHCCQTPSGTAPFASRRTAPTLGLMVLVDGQCGR